jgi:hypothetical protein
MHLTGQETQPSYKDFYTSETDTNEVITIIQIGKKKKDCEKQKPKRKTTKERCQPTNKTPHNSSNNNSSNKKPPLIS